MSALGVVMPAHFFRSFKVERCHCTLIYLGEHDKHPEVFRQRKAVEAATERLKSQATILNVRVTGVEVFGNGTKTVLTLDDTVLKSYRKFIDRELLRSGLYSASSWAYRPHVTINDHEPSERAVIPSWMNQIPGMVYLDLPELWWASPAGAE